MPLDTGNILNNRYRIVRLLGQGCYSVYPHYGSKASTWTCQPWRLSSPGWQERWRRIKSVTSTPRHSI